MAKTKPSSGAARPRSARNRKTCGKTLGGTPGEVAAKIAEFAEIGAERVYLQVLDLGDLDHLELLASDVSPQV